jgi:(p)ppGpp synthase/HD superfamily hydrolase
MDNSIAIKAREYARTKHKGQRDDVGKDNFTVHINKVAEIVSFVSQEWTVTTIITLMVMFVLAFVQRQITGM